MPTLMPTIKPDANRLERMLLDVKSAAMLLISLYLLDFSDMCGLSQTVKWCPEEEGMHHFLSAKCL